MTCQHEFPDLNPRVHDARPMRDEATRLAALMQAMRSGLKHRMERQTPDARYHGELACMVYARASGMPYTPDPLVCDPGFDFPDGTDVKASVHPKGGWYRPMNMLVNLRQHRDHAGKTKQYALVAVDLATMRANVWVVVSYDRFDRDSFVIGDESQPDAYRRMDAAHARRRIAAETPNVCLMCGADRLRDDGSVTLFDPPPPAPPPAMQRFGSVARLEETRGFIDAMRRSLEEGPPDGQGNPD
jgi:hypothetical protein